MGPRRAHVVALSTLFAAVLAGCSWLVGVSEDPVVVAPLATTDAADEPEAPVVHDGAVAREAAADAAAATDAHDDVE